jgi:phage baseplate assembly protein W
MPPVFHAIHYPFAIANAAGRVRRQTDYERYIRQLIRQVLLTAPGERINRPTFGAGGRRLVFSPLNPATASVAQTTVYNALTGWLDALIKVEDVRVSVAGPSTLGIDVTYLIRARGARRFLNVEVTE